MRHRRHSTRPWRRLTTSPAVRGPERARKHRAPQQEPAKERDEPVFDDRCMPEKACGLKIPSLRGGMDIRRFDTGQRERRMARTVRSPMEWFPPSSVEAVLYRRRLCRDLGDRDQAWRGRLTAQQEMPVGRSHPVRRRIFKAVARCPHREAQGPPNAKAGARPAFVCSMRVNRSRGRLRGECGFLVVLVLGHQLFLAHGLVGDVDLGKQMVDHLLLIDRSA